MKTQLPFIEMKIPVVSGIVLLGTTLLASSCPAAQDAVPSQYTLTARMSSRWFSANGELLSSNQISTRISVDSDRAVIQPWASDKDESLVFFTWATSPFRTNEWLVGGQSKGLKDALTNVFINNHPVLGSQDTYGNLMRILYLPANHPTYRGIPSGERLYIPIESSTYPPGEIDIRVSERTAGAEQIESSIEAVSPPYYFGRHRVRLPFEDPSSTRKLWTLVITENTNWHGLLLPSKFRYTRYQDPADRARAESRKPIVLITGSLVSAELGANTDIRLRLAEELSVADVRVTAALGRAVRYRAKPGAWPEINSQEFDKLIEANRPWPPPAPFGGR